MRKKAERPTRPRPYFLPASVNYDSLPEAVKAAFDEIIQPTYEELVTAPQTGLERSAGMTVVFLLLEELLGQFDLGKQIDLCQAMTGGDREARDKALHCHLRLVSAKQTAVNALLRVRKLTAQRRVSPLEDIFGAENGNT